MNAPVHRAQRPWWLLPIFGPIPNVDQGSITLLGLVSLAYFFENYDLSLMMSALSYIAADFGIPESQLAGYTGLIRLGALPAFLLVPLADRLGRRRMFLAAVAGIALLTFATAFAPSVGAYVAIQMLVRTCVLVASTMAFVIVAEEFPAEHRGWGIGMVGALGACGFGFGAILFGFVERLPWRWRALYAVGVFPLLVMPRLRRGIPETRRFDQHRRENIGTNSVGGVRGWLEPLLGLARGYPRRLAGVTLAGALYAAGETGVFQFCGYFTLNTHHWEPWRFSLMVVVAGGVGMLGNVLAGRLGDLFGRRPVGFAVAASFPGLAWLFYHLPGFYLPVLWAFLTVCSVSCNVTIRALATEVFPTSQRGTSGGWLSLVQTLGTAAGLGIVGLGLARGASLPAMVSTLAVLTIVAGASLFLLPETSGRELEEISS
ncbi:MFS transporter [Candidatus Binatia bacterium]|nr:MFS transporter [Candidatus Binatia bacterium]